MRAGKSPIAFRNLNVTKELNKCFSGRIRRTESIFELVEGQVSGEEGN